MADDVLKEGLEAFEECAEAESENRNEAKDDLRFARLGEQWPEEAVKARGNDRPCLTLNRMPAFQRQVINDARQNKPAIKVKPVDSGADVETAKIYNGLIRNIEHTSNADVAYDTAAEFAVSMGWGYIRVAIDYACDDTFDKDLTIKRVANPFSVFGDPYSTEADSSDWNVGFVTDLMGKEQFRRRWKGAEEVNWDDQGYSRMESPWMEDGQILVAEWWKREETQKKILLLSDGTVIDAKQFTTADETGLSPKDIAEAQGIVVVRDRMAKGYQVRQRIMTGAEVLEENVWAGRYIPLIPVYGEEVNVEGKRHFRSLIRDVKDAQRMFNYWRTTTTELVCLAPKAPYIGPKGAFKTDATKWATANTATHAYIEYDGAIPPQRQPFAGVPAGALQEALNASDDMKSILGMYDASLGARSNETSGKAIMARQREGDVSTFHFVDNLTRAIRHTGRVLIDLIPHVYSGPRIVRVLGEKPGDVKNVPVNQPAVQTQDGGYAPVQPGTQQMPDGVRMFDLTKGKYDLAVEAGPMYTTRREESVNILTELLRAFPQAAPVVGDILLRLMDFPEAEEISKRMQALVPQGVDPQAVEKMKAELEKLQRENQQLKAKLPLEAAKVETDRFEAETDRMRTIHEITKPPEPAPERAF